MGNIDVAGTTDQGIQGVAFIALDITDGVIGLLLNRCVVDGDGGGVTNLSGSCPIAVELDGEGLCPFCGQIIGKGMGKGDGSIGLNQA